MVGMAGIDITEYYHSKIHMAVLTRNYDFLNVILSDLPPVASDPSTAIQTEDDAIADIEAADARSAVVDARDVPNRDTPLHLAVKLHDITSTFLLMEAGADWNLQNEKGWTALEEAACMRDQDIVKVILRRVKPLQWAKWRRGLPLVVRDLETISDFYTEIVFQFESTVIPLVQRIAPSDTIKIWKKGASLRADTTLGSFDVFKSKRSDHSVLFFGEELGNGRAPPGSLWTVSHESKTARNIFSAINAPVSEEEIEHEVARMLEEDICRPGVDVTRAYLVVSKKNAAKTEMVGQWKASLYHMHDAVLSLKSRPVLPGAAAEKDDAFAEFGEATSGELMAFRIESPEIFAKHEEAITGGASNSDDRGRRGWYGNLREKCSKLREEAQQKVGSLRGSQARNCKRSNSNAKDGQQQEKGKGMEREHTMKFRPDLWLTLDFPLKIGELLPLFDILGHKIKPIRRLKELLSTTLPPGTFPVKISFPVIPAIRVNVSFTKFELLPPSKEFHTPPSTPPALEEDSETERASSSPSQLMMMEGLHLHYSWKNPPKPIDCAEDDQDPFLIPSDYVWICEGEKKTRIHENRRKSRRGELIGLD